MKSTRPRSTPLPSRPAHPRAGRGRRRPGPRSRPHAGCVQRRLERTVGRSRRRRPEPSEATEAPPPLETTASLGKVTGKLPQDKRSKVRQQVARAVDAWLDAAYVGGDYPRNDFDTAWPGFTTGAKVDAKADKALMSNQDIGAQIDAVEATTRKVTVDVLAVKGHAAGATARVVAEVPDRRRRAAQGGGTRPPVPHADPRRLAHLRLRRDEGSWRR